MELQRKISGLKLRSKLNQKIEEATQIILRRRKKYTVFENYKKML